MFERVGIECTQGELIVGGDEYCRRHPLRTNLFDDFESIHFGHLDIEKYQIRIFSAERGHRVLTISAFSNHLETAFPVQHAADAQAGYRLIIDDDGRQLHWLARPLCAGILSRTQTTPRPSSERSRILFSPDNSCD